MAQLQGANLSNAQLQGADLLGAQLQGADLRGAALWRALVPEERNWDLADLRDSTVAPMTKTEADETIAVVSAAIANERGRRMVVEELANTLGTGDGPSRPEFPEFPAAWRLQPNVMFNASDPKPEPFPWGKPTWTEQTYDKALAKFLGDLACGGNVSAAQTGVLASRALNLLPHPSSNEPGRLWPKLFAARVVGPDCPQARGLTEETGVSWSRSRPSPGRGKTPKRPRPARASQQKHRVNRGNVPHERGPSCSFPGLRRRDPTAGWRGRREGCCLPS
jgi:hypothetical protein